MTTINTLLYSVQSQAPALLQVGGGRTENYNNLATLTDSLWGEGQSSWPGLGATSGSSDVVTLAYQKIGDKIITDLAALTAEAIKADPGLDNDYVIALVDTDAGREARVYRRSEILAGFEGSAEEKKALSAQLAANPLQVFTSAQGLPAGSDDQTCRELAADLNEFLKTNGKTLDALKKAGFDAFINLGGAQALKTALAGFQPEIFGLDEMAES